MRHRVGYRKLGRKTPHRTALLRNLATALFEHESIQTTLMKAKELRPFAEKLITLAKREGDRLHARRLAARDIKDADILKKLFDTLGPRFASRNGGYSRILRLSPRKGDGSEVAMIELLGSEYKPEKKDEKGKAKPEAREKKAEGAKDKQAAKPKADRPKRANKAKEAAAE